MDTEALDGYRELADVTGWPEWGAGEHCRRCLKWNEGRWWFFTAYMGGPWFRSLALYTACEALPFWERHVRLWLEEHDVAIDYVPAVKKYYLRFDLGRLPIKTIDALQALPDWFDGYHEAQQAATRAMREAA